MLPLVGIESRPLINLWFQVQHYPGMPAHRYMGENGSAAILAAKRSAGVAPEAAHSGFETQRRRHQKSKKGASVAQKKGTYIHQILFKKCYTCVSICESDTFPSFLITYLNCQIRIPIPFLYLAVRIGIWIWLRAVWKLHHSAM